MSNENIDFDAVYQQYWTNIAGGLGLIINEINDSFSEANLAKRSKFIDQKITDNFSREMRKWSSKAQEISAKAAAANNPKAQATFARVAEEFLKGSSDIYDHASDVIGKADKFIVSYAEELRH
ncbi:hypothetical protein J7554_09130 [Wohlfahrtiimonas chitiniclastica]|uniref:hypothetical protein n=1 Tax=Wohlfahrtiimonas chitiniclastica TaxID=400946 RepID=UPI001BCB1646|nr:hypothetical protein [Wohlfahrtiimonas chitiniclastica]MBS7829285.1 hypothetical protein [Wohlfahrtiimonas chitiniclastica]